MHKHKHEGALYAHRHHFTPHSTGHPPVYIVTVCYTHEHTYHHHHHLLVHMHTHIHVYTCVGKLTVSRYAQSSIN